MALKTQVKVSDVNNLTDARYAAGMEVNFVGFPIVGEKAISYEEYTAITGWLSGVDFVGEFKNEPIEEVLSSQKKYGFESIQTSSIDVVNQLNEIKNVFYSINLSELNDRLSLPTNTILVVETEKETLEEGELDLLKNLAQNHTVLLDGGFTATNVNDLLESVSIQGVAIKSSEEIRPGYKDMDELADILEELEVIDY